MDTIMALAEYNFIEVAKLLFVLVSAIILVVRAIESVLKKASDIFLKMYKKKRGKEEAEETVEALSKRIDIIEKTQKNNVEMFTEHELGVLAKLDELSQKFDDMKESNDKTDRALLRDRIIGAMRFFGQNRDDNGVVHISRSDHENLSSLFAEYFSKSGNGTVKVMYENEFLKYTIDN